MVKCSKNINITIIVECHWTIHKENLSWSRNMGFTGKILTVVQTSFQVVSNLDNYQNAVYRFCFINTNPDIF